MNKFLRLTSVIILALLIDVNNSYSKTSDCFERVNRTVFSFNMALDKAILKPVSKGYSYLPSPVKASIGNATSNVSYLVTIPNQILQGKIYAAANDTGRFLINTTVGILGLFDPASGIGLEKKEHEDYGQTLGVWGVGHGCYVVLPIFGPSTVRDTVGKVANMALDPFYLSTVGDKELLLDNNLGDRTYYIEQGFDKINWRAENGKSIDDLEKNSIDFYASVKSVYLQKRDNLTNDGKSTADDEWKEFK
jgi:phospholipid-binding lipoprotein MlaA